MKKMTMYRHSVTTWLVVLLLAVGGGAVEGQMTPRAGSPRMVAMEHVQAILDAEPGQLESVLEEAVAPVLFDRLGREGVVQLATQLRSALEGASPAGGRPEGPTRLTMVFTHPGGERRVTIGLQAEDPHRLTEIDFDATVQGEAAAEPSPTPAGYPTVDLLARELVELLGRADFEGAVERQTLPRLRERYGEDELVRIFGELRGGLGPSGDALTLVGVEEEEDHLWVHVEGEGGGEYRFRVFVTDEAPYLLRGVDTRATPVFAGPTPTPEAWPELIRDFVDERARRGEFSGAVAVGRHGVPIFAEAWGVADAETGRRVTPETPMNLGSMNKMFTGLALAQLEAEGMVDFEEVVGTYLPDYPNDAIRDEATIHQLLTHTAGVPGYWNEAFEAGRDTLDTVEGIASTFVREPLLFDPGKSWEYSNGGPVVAGLVLEAVTGSSYYDYMRTHVYGPAGMDRTDHYRRTDASSGLAIGYGSIVDGEPRDPNTEAMGIVGSPAGGGYSTILDLVRFAGALDDGTLLSREALETVWSPPSRGPEASRYGYLWSNGSEAGHRWVGHNGGGPGVSADFRYFPDSGYVVVVLSNVSGGAMPVSNWITQLVVEGIDAEVGTASDAG